MIDSQVQPGSACNLTSAWPSSGRIDSWAGITATATTVTTGTPINDVMSFVLNDCCEWVTRRLGWPCYGKEGVGEACAVLCKETILVWWGMALFHPVSYIRVHPLPLQMPTTATR